VATTSTSKWILAATASSQASKPEFQHSSPTFEPRILEATMGTSTRRASTTVGSASMDDTDVAMTFFFATDDKTHIRAFQFTYS
jgi:hypothetical protein